MARHGIIRIGALVLLSGFILYFYPINNFGSAPNIQGFCQTSMGLLVHVFSQGVREGCDQINIVVDGIYGLIGMGLILVVVGSVIPKRKSVYSCGYCNYVTSTESDFQEHYERTHKLERQQEESASGDAGSLRQRPPTYYDILGITPTASNEEIKKAYRTLVIIWHPDKSKGKKDSDENFKTIKEAYEILINKERRQAYDRTINR
jgi:hypothetical protein